MLTNENARQLLEEIAQKGGLSTEQAERSHPADIAEAIDQITGDEERLKAFDSLGLETGSEVLPLLEDHSRELILEHVPAEELGDLIGEMDSDDAADILGDMDERKAEDVLEVVPDEVDQEVSRLMEHHEESAGGIMQAELVSVPESYTISEATEELRSRSDEVGEVHNIFIVDSQNRLKGTLPLSDLILNAGTRRVSDIVEALPLIYATAEADQEYVAELFKHYDIVSLPVVDSEMKLLGRILHDDVIDVMEEEINEDIMIMAGADDEALVQTHTVLEMVRYRLPWLVASLFGGLLTGALILWFKVAIAKAIALAAFIPVVMGLSGNVGTQSSALVIRGIATGKINIASLAPYIIKELKIGIALGIICGGVAGIVTDVWMDSAWFGVVVGISIFLAIAFAAILGACIPLVFRWANVDPAIAGGPIVLAVADMTGLLIFFGVATALLSYLD